MRLLILFLCILSVQGRFSKGCEDDINNCQVSDFEFDEDFAPDGICGGVTYMSGTNVTGGTGGVKITDPDKCGWSYSCQIVGPLQNDYKCNDMRLSITREACNQYVGTAVCKYDHHKQMEIVYAVIAGVLVLLLLLILMCRYIPFCKHMGECLCPHHQTRERRAIIMSGYNPIRETSSERSKRF